MRGRTFRILAAAVLAYTGAAPAFSQFWEEPGLPAWSPSPTVVYADTVHDWLLVAGQNALFVDGSTYMGLFRYNGTVWDTLGLFGNKVLAAIVYHDTLIVGGGFPWMHNDSIGVTACYVDGQWYPFGEIGGPTANGSVQRFRIVDGELYALGIFALADGQVANGLAKRVGGHWEPVPGWPSIGFTGDPWVHDIIRYQGQLIVCGNFNTPDMVIKDLAYFGGKEWLPFCDDCLHGGMEAAFQLVEYQGDLYLGGSYTYATGNAGQGIMRWDGEQWYPLGPVGHGVQKNDNSDWPPPQILQVERRNGLLYLGGIFNYVNHMPTPGIASWDGTDFCAMEGGALTVATNRFAFYHDTLYIGTSPPVTFGQGLLRYLGAYDALCSTLGVEDEDPVDHALQVAWSPHGELTLLGLSDGAHQLKVYDAQGRLVLEQAVQSQAGRTNAVPLREAGTSLFLVVVDNLRTGRLVPIH